MPRGDGTGPLGQGPRTGKGLGKCGSKRARTSELDFENIVQGEKRRNYQNSDSTSSRGQGAGKRSGRRKER